MAAFQMLPAEERQAITVAQIEAVDTIATDELRTRVAQLEQEITRERGLLQQSRQRLQEAEQIHQRVAGSLIEERDAAQQALDQEQSETERLRKLLAEARKPGAGAPAKAPARHTETPAAPVLTDPTGVTEAVVVVVNCDVPGLLTDLRGLTEKLERLAQINRDDLSADDRGALDGAFQKLSRTLQVLLKGSWSG